MPELLKIVEDNIDAGGMKIPLDMILDDLRGTIWFFDPADLTGQAGAPFLELCRRAVRMVFAFFDEAPPSLRDTRFAVFAGSHGHFQGASAALLLSEVNARVYERIRRHAPAALASDSGSDSLLSTTNFVPLIRYERGKLIGYLSSAIVDGEERHLIPDEYLAREELEVRYGCVLPRDEKKQRFWCWNGDNEVSNRNVNQAPGGERPWEDPEFLAGLRPPVVVGWDALPDPSQPRTMLYPERFPELHRFFLEKGGESYHLSDMKGDVHLLVKLSLQDCPAVAEADWTVEWKPRDEGKVDVVLVAHDNPDDPLNLPFGFTLKYAEHAHDLLRLVEQEEVSVSLLAPANEGLAFFEGRQVQFPLNFRRELAEYLRTALPGRYEDFPTAHEEAILAALNGRETRLSAARMLCATGLERFIPPVSAVLGKITWAEAGELAELLPNFGDRAVPALIEAAQSGKKATAACAMRALGALGGPAAAEALAERVVTLPTKGEAIEALIDTGEAAVPLLMGLLAHSRGEVRETAAYGLGKLRAQEALGELQQLATSDRNQQVRTMAGRAVQWLRGEELCEESLRMELPTGES